MTNCCDTSNPLIRDGVSQRQRQITALSPDSVKVDEQDLADFLVFAYQLSQQIIYYKANGQTDDNEPDGTWQSFFTSSVPVQLALISKTRPQLVRDTYHRQLDTFLGDRTPPKLAPVLLTWSRILDRIRQWSISVESYSPFLSIIRGLAKSNLRDALLRLWAFEQSYILEAKQPLLRATFYQQFKDTFHLDIDILTPPAADHTPLKGTLLEARTELDQVFQILFQNYRQIIQQAPAYLMHSLESRRDHPPHLAIYLAFWDVLKPARDDLNRMTQRHLDFFYGEVLRFPEKAVQPDRTHLIFELAKFQQEYKLNSGTAFKAGKDASGVELIYKLGEDIVLHKAQIASLKGLFLASQTTETDKEKQLTGLHASPSANSADGQGGEFPKDQVVKAWKPFGDDKRPQATVGLAIASNLLLLKEGNRTITIQLDLKENPSEQMKSVSQKLFDLPAATLNTVLQKLFQVKLSGAKDWIQAPIPFVTREPLTNGGSATDRLTIKVEVPLDQPAIVPCHNALKQPSLPTIQQPVLLLQINTELIPVINPEDNSNVRRFSAYHFLRSFDLTQLTLTVTVDAVRNLVVQNDLAVLDATKPFQPFGSQPKVGSNVYIGSQEVFQKPLSNLGVSITLEREKPSNWSEIYATYGVSASNQFDQKTFEPGLLKFYALRNKTWYLLSDTEKDKTLFSQSILLTDQLKRQELKAFVDINPSENWTPQTQNGFLRLQLTGNSFLHDQYTTVLVRQVLAAATSELLDVAGVSGKQRKSVIGAYYRIDKGTPFPATDYYVAAKAEPLIPQEPYTPVITSLSLSYTAEAQYPPPPKPDNIQLSDIQLSDIQLFHLYPFDGFSAIATPLPISLLPTFVDEGTLYIGIQDLNPPTALPLLIQVAEETADTELVKAPVQWSYLADNIWHLLEEHQVISDGTNGLITSGIINLAIPAIKKDNTLLNSNLYWIKVSVAERSGAICDIIGIHTQAAPVTFSDQGNDPAHLTAPLPGGAVAKLADPQPAVKKVEQPYSSFGGQGKEAAAHYYIRVSEHLRHKGRAVTIFDYERLVLERFPEIYKVRCINHGRMNDQISDPKRDNLQELVPGSVTLAVIPDLSHRTTTNDLEPKVNVNLLEDIRKYLVELSSSWVDIQVVNPRYEAIQTEFQVKFKSPYDGNFGYYQRELQRAIIGFLSPWTVNSGADIHFGGKFYRSSILNFVEEQPYVDYVLKFQMHQGNQRNLREVVAASARSIFVSVAFADNPNMSTGHIIHAVDDCPANRPVDSGVLGYDRLDHLTLE